MGLPAIPIEKINKRIPENSLLRAVEYLEGRYIGSNGNMQRMVKCKCKCGKFKNAVVSDLMRGIPLSCGCLPRGSKPGAKYKKKPVVQLNVHKDEKKQQAAPVVKKVKVEKKKDTKKPPAKKSVPSNKPTNLDELKALCPANLKGLHRSDWIRMQRIKYDI